MPLNKETKPNHLNFLFCICCLFVRFSSFFSFLCITAPNQSRQTTYILLQKDVICWLIRPLRWVVSKKESSRSTFFHIAIWLPVCHWILGLLGMSPGRCRSAMGSWTLWGCSWFISPLFNLHSPVGKLRRSSQRALWIRNPCKLLNSPLQSHVLAGYISKSFPFEQIWLVIYSPSPLQTPRGHLSFVVLFIFFTFLFFKDVTPTSWRLTLSFQRVILLSRGS